MRATKPTPFLKPGFLAPKGDRPIAASASERPGSTPNVSGKQAATAPPPKPTPFLKPGFLLPTGDRPSAASASEQPGSTPNVSGKQATTAPRPKPTSLDRGFLPPNGERAATTPQHSAQELHKDEIPLAGYLLAHDAVADPVTDTDLDLLRESDASVREARELLPLGRGNVREDLEATLGLSTFACLCMKDLQNMIPERAEAIALLMEAGVCSDYAALSGWSLAARTSQDVEARAAKQVGVDHVWTEAARDGKYEDRAHTVVLDAWCTGPAVFAPNSRFGSASERNEAGLDLRRGEPFYERFAR